MKLTLASKSAARTTVLSGAGVPFATAGAGVDEDAVKRTLLAEGAGPKEIAGALAEAKAVAVSTGREGLVIGADQTLWLVMHSDLAGSRRVRVLADHLIALFADHQDRLAMP